MSNYSFKRGNYIEQGMCPCVKSLLVCAWHRQICLSWWSVSALWSRGQGWLWSGLRLEEEGTGAVERWWGLWLWPGIDDSVTGREGAHPRATAPQHQTCRIMLIYGDGWAALSTESGQVHQRIYLFTRLKGAKASAKQRLTLRVRPGPELRDLHWDYLQIVVRPRRRHFRLCDVCLKSDSS